MAYLIFIFGFLLSAIGSYELFYGYTITDIERGSTAVIAGAVFLTGGLIAISLGLLDRSLNRLIPYLEDLGSKSENPAEPTQADREAEVSAPILPEPEPRAVYFEPPALRGAPQDAQTTTHNKSNEAQTAFAPRHQEAEPLGAFGEAAPSLRPALATADEFARSDSSIPPAQTLSAARNVPSSAPVLRETKFMPPRWGAERVPAPQPESTNVEIEAPQPSLELRPSLETQPEPPIDPLDSAKVEAEAAAETHPIEHHQEQVPGHSPLPAQAEKPVTGRYEADGVVYSMFHDGSIEVRSATEVVVYASMDELKASFAEREAEG